MDVNQTAELPDPWPTRTVPKLEEFAVAARLEEMVAALSLISNVPTAVVARNMRDTHAESLMVLAKAIGLSWETTRSIMALVAKRYRRFTSEIDQARTLVIACVSRLLSKFWNSIVCQSALRAGISDNPNSVRRLYRTAPRSFGRRPASLLHWRQS